MQSSIYERIGGGPSVTAAVDLFYQKVWSDPTLVGYFGDVDRSRLKAHQRAFLSAALGGSERYEGRGMGEAHAGLGVTDAAFDKVVAHLAATLAELGVDEATIGEIAGALGPLKADIVQPEPAPLTEARGLRRLLRMPRLRRPA
ncbi:MAG: group I truncated hemoglobin [Egibacteraceae bacterium]